MLYVVSGTQVKVGGVFLVSLQKMVCSFFQVLKRVPSPCPSNDCSVCKNGCLLWEVSNTRPGPSSV